MAGQEGHGRVGQVLQGGVTGWRAWAVQGNASSVPGLGRLVPGFGRPRGIRIRPSDV